MKLSWKHFINFSFLLELFLYAFSLLLALGIALNNLSKSEVFSSGQPVDSVAAAWQFLISFALATLILVLILKYYKKPYLIKGLFYLAMIEGLLIFSRAYFKWPYFIVILVLILFYWFVFRNVLIHDVVIVLAVSAISVLFGFNLTPIAAILILLIIALYDFWAVYKTKHMVKMFQGMAEAKVHFALIIPHNFKSLFNKVKEVMPQTDYMFLGTGDLAIPAIFMISCLKINLFTSLFVALGAICGLILLHIIFITQEERRPMPGLPPIIFGAFLGFLISLLL
jgi:presenilin-like A22 family membrane protease